MAVPLYRNAASTTRASPAWKPALRLVWLAALTAVVVLSCVPATSLPGQALQRIPLNDKAEHYAAYLFLSLLPALHERRPVLRRLALALVALGAAIEFCQIAAEGRHFGLDDMLADACGVASGLLLGWPLRNRFRLFRARQR